MKHLLTFLFLFISIAINAQFGAHIGLNSSWYNNGKPLYKTSDKTFTGIKYSYQSFTGGLFYKAKHLQYELNIMQMGAKNPEENNRVFKPMYINLPITYLIHAGSVDFHLGGFSAYCFTAKNFDFFTPGNNFDWKTGKWEWYNKFDFGIKTGFDIYLGNGSIGFFYQHGLTDTRSKGSSDFKMRNNTSGSLTANFYYDIYNFARKIKK